MKRVIQREILDPLALQVVSGELDSGEKLLVDWQEEKIVFQKDKKIAKSKKKE